MRKGLKLPRYDRADSDGGYLGYILRLVSTDASEKDQKLWMSLVDEPCVFRLSFRMVKQPTIMTNILTCFLIGQNS